MKLGNEQKAKTELEATYELDEGDFAADSTMALSRMEKHAGHHELADLWAWRRIRHFGFLREALEIRAEIAFTTENWLEAVCHFKELIHTAAPGTPESEIEKLHYHICVGNVRYRNQYGLPVIAPITEFLTQYPQSEARYRIIDELSLPRYQPLPAGFIDFLDYGFTWDGNRAAEQFTYMYLQADEFMDAFRWKVSQMLNENRIKDAELIDMARLLDKGGMEVEAIEQFQRLKNMGIEAQDANFEFDHAGMLFKQKQYEEAAARYQQWLVSNPDSHLTDEALFWLGESYFRIEKWALSLGVFQRLSEKMEPEHESREKVLLRIIINQFQLKKWSDLLETAEKFKQHFKDSPQMVNVLYQEGIAAANTGDLDHAVSVLSVGMDRVEDPEFLEEIKSAIRRIEVFRRKRMATPEPAGSPVESNQLPSPTVLE